MRGDNIRLVAAIIATILFIFIVAKHCSRAAAAESGKSDQEQIREVQDQMTKASLSGDAAGFVKHLADGYTSTQANGNVLNKDEVLKNRASGQVKFDSIDVSQLHITIRGNSAVANFKAVIRSQTNGRDTGGTFQLTRTWVKQDGEWKVAADQATRIKDKKN